MAAGANVLQLDLIQTTAAALAVLALGAWLNRNLRLLRAFNIPEPVVGGLVFSALSAALYWGFRAKIAFDLSLQPVFMLMFFTTIGLGATLRLLVRGGPKVLLFLLLASVLLATQNSLGLVLARIADLHPVQGLLLASITQSGGHGTGATYASLFADSFNLQGTMEMAMAAATFGLVLGGLIGGPVAKWIIDSRKLSTPPAGARGTARTGEQLAVGQEAATSLSAPVLLETLLVIAACMVGGQFLYKLLQGRGFTLPAFVCSLFVGLAVANAADLTRVYRLKANAVDAWGTVGLSLFLAEALMSLRLWELVDLALPMIGILVTQATAMMLFARFITFHVMGRDYDAAVMAAGHCGFGLGATPTAVANMEATVKRYGPSPQAFLVVPMVGAFFIDITNALMIQLFLALPWSR